MVGILFWDWTVFFGCGSVGIDWFGVGEKDLFVWEGWGEDGVVEGGETGGIGGNAGEESSK